jgi:hypothetical protein
VILGSKKLADEIRRGNDGDPNGIAIVPAPDLLQLEQSGEASVNLRLGPHDTPPYPFMPSPTFAHSSSVGDLKGLDEFLEMQWFESRRPNRLVSL